MAATRSGAWSAWTTGSLPTGSLTINSGSNRMFVMILITEKNGEQTVTTFTVGGRTFDYTDNIYLDDGGSDLEIIVFIWNETAIAAMSGTTVSFAGISSGTDLSWGYATIQGTAQSLPVITSNSSASATSINVTTTSVASGLIVGAMMDGAASRAPLTGDTLTQRLEFSVSVMANAVFDGGGGDNTTTFANDGTANEMVALGIVFASTANTVPMLPKMLNEGEING